MELVINDIDDDNGNLLEQNQPFNTEIESGTIESDASDVTWDDTGTGIVRYSTTYGNYVVASRFISKGEIIIEEFPIQMSPYGIADLLPFCLTCCKDLALSERCTKCKWPICDNHGSCENDPAHSQAECPVFVSKNVRPKCVTNRDYAAIEVLRALLLRSKDPMKWSKIVKLEAHSASRKLSQEASDDTQFIMDFILKKCKLTQFEPPVIDHVIGVFTVNTFWAVKDLQKYASLLFDRVTLLAHDCDPNTERQIMEKEHIVDGTNKSRMFMQIKAARDILPEELITVHYTDCSKSVTERRKYLKEVFFFDCGCKRCLIELLENTDNNGN